MEAGRANGFFSFVPIRCQLNAALQQSAALNLPTKLLRNIRNNIT